MTHVAANYQPAFRELGLDAGAIFDHPLIKPWRVLPDRQNCTLDTTLADGHTIRWHVKRFEASASATSPAEVEVQGHRLLEAHQIPTAALVAWGSTDTRRSFVIFEDLAGYCDGEKLVESGVAFDRVLEPTAGLAARLHAAGLHHRDLYLCHFFIKLNGEAVDVRLIDAARVRALPGLFTRKRWIIKDLAQFWYSTMSLPVTDAQRTAWLERYASQSGAGPADSLARKIARKVAWIGRHDRQLRREQPTRNISIPQ